MNLEGELPGDLEEKLRGDPEGNFLLSYPVQDPRVDLEML